MKVQVFLLLANKEDPIVFVFDPGSTIAEVLFELNEAYGGPAIGFKAPATVEEFCKMYDVSINSSIEEVRKVNKS